MHTYIYIYIYIYMYIYIYISSHALYLHVYMYTCMQGGYAHHFWKDRVNAGCHLVVDDVYTMATSRMTHWEDEFPGLGSQIPDTLCRLLRFIPIGSHSNLLVPRDYLEPLRMGQASFVAFVSFFGGNIGTLFGLFFSKPNQGTKGTRGFGGFWMRQNPEEGRVEERLGLPSTDGRRARAGECEICGCMCQQLRRRGVPTRAVWGLGG